MPLGFGFGELPPEDDDGVGVEDAGEPSVMSNANEASNWTEEGDLPTLSIATGFVRVGTSPPPPPPPPPNDPRRESKAKEKSRPPSSSQSPSGSRRQPRPSPSRQRTSANGDDRPRRSPSRRTVQPSSIVTGATAGSPSPGGSDDDVTPRTEHSANSWEEEDGIQGAFNGRRKAPPSSRGPPPSSIIARQKPSRSTQASSSYNPPKSEEDIGKSSSCFPRVYLLILCLILILVGGGAFAALYFTGLIFPPSSSETANGFSFITTSPTAADGSTSLEGSWHWELTKHPTAMRRPTARPTLRPVAVPGISAPTRSPTQNLPVSTATPCTQTSAPFKYFVNGNRDDEIFSSCAKLTASADPNFLKCYREVVFGNGKLVRDLCPIMCGNCAGDKNDEADKEQADEDFDGHKTFSFYVIGDVPYLLKQEIALVEQLRDQTNNLKDDDIFQVHVGDIQNPKKTRCDINRYKKVAKYFTDNSGLPNLFLPGDNDWNDCPNSDAAWQYWASTFIPFEKNWAGRSAFPATVDRMPGQEVNFGFVRGGVVFLGLNLVGGQTNKYITQSDWDTIIENDIEWAKKYLNDYKVGDPEADPNSKEYVRGIVAFGHSARGRRFNKFLQERLSQTDIPVVYIHGNGHTYQAEQSFKSDKWYNYWRIQVDMGYNAPPARFTVRGTTKDALDLDMSVDKGMVFPGGFMKFDRRGGTYPGAVPVDENGIPLVEEDRMLDEVHELL